MIDTKDLEVWAGFLLDHSLRGITADDRVMIKGEAVCWPLMAVPASAQEHEFIGSKNCKKCHTDEAAGGPGANFDLSVWVLGNVDDRGNLNVSAPPAATAGAYCV